MTSIAKYGQALAEWSDKTFPKDRTAMRCLLHLKKEVQEVIDAPHDRMEFADCFMLLIDAYRKQFEEEGNNTPDDLINDAYKKLEICRKRIWGAPDEDGVIRHVKA